MIDITNKEECCGCSACFNACPAKAIEMIEDEFGFKYPKVNKEKCTNCGLCDKVCPIKENTENKNAINAYAVINKNDDVRMNSSSGGIFSLLAEEILNDNGVVFGVQFDEKFKVIHSYIDEVNDISKFRGSKYVQSEIGNSYCKVKDFLISGRKVLFTGTPCQVEGLKSYLGKEYDNLYTQDIICHGVPSPKVWEKYKEYRKKQDKEEPNKINFRDKIDGWKLFNITFKYEKFLYNKNLREDLYLKAFLKDICLRDSCYACKFKKHNRISDITLADFWGIENIKPHLDDDKGTSLVITNSNKGRELFEKIANKVRFEEVNLDEAIKYNLAMIKSVSKHKNREKFFKDIDKMEFDKLMKKYINSLKDFKRFLSRVKRKVLKLLGK